RFFMFPGLISFGFGVVVGIRYLYLYAIEGGQGHVQSLILTAILLLAGFQLAIFGLLAEIMGNNRKISEDIQWRVRRLEYDSRDRARDDHE
ncbi:MAG: glycosyltransferase family 2 protein, partial [Coriobacteriia bacterium]|nr:glycosyltransferase family 2 protein [Coriobacteriia bacterium]